MRIFPLISPRRENLPKKRESFPLILKKEMSRVDEDYDDLLKRIAAVEPAQEELHKLRHKLRQQERELTHLRKYLSDATVALHTERESNQAILADCSAIRAAQAEDRKRMQELLALTALNTTGGDELEKQGVTFVGGATHRDESDRFPRRRAREAAVPVNHRKSTGGKGNCCSIDVNNSVGAFGSSDAMLVLLQVGERDLLFVRASLFLCLSDHVNLGRN
jgi:hypothetical protein